MMLARLVHVGDARGDGDALDGGAAGAELLDQALALPVQVPEVGVEVEQVDHVGRAGREEPRELLRAQTEVPLGDLTAARQLAHEARVGRGGHDGRLRGGRRHAGQEHRRPAREAAERVVEHDLARGRPAQRRGEACGSPAPRGSSRRRERVARAGLGGEREHVHAEAAAVERGELRDGVAGAVVEHVRDAIAVARTERGADRSPAHGLDVLHTKQRREERRVVGGRAQVGAVVAEHRESQRAGREADALAREVVGERAASVRPCSASGTAQRPRRTPTRSRCGRRPRRPFAKACFSASRNAPSARAKATSATRAGPETTLRA